MRLNRRLRSVPIGQPGNVIPLEGVELGGSGVDTVRFLEQLELVDAALDRQAIPPVRDPALAPHGRLEGLGGFPIMNGDYWLRHLPRGASGLRVPFRGVQAEVDVSAQTYNTIDYDGAKVRASEINVGLYLPGSDHRHVHLLGGLGLRRAGEVVYCQIGGDGLAEGAAAEAQDRLDQFSQDLWVDAEGPDSQAAGRTRATIEAALHQLRDEV